MTAARASALCALLVGGLACTGCVALLGDFDVEVTADGGAADAGDGDGDHPVDEELDAGADAGEFAHDAGALDAGGDALSTCTLSSCPACSGALDVQSCCKSDGTCGCENIFIPGSCESVGVVSAEGGACTPITFPLTPPRACAGESIQAPGEVWSLRSEPQPPYVLCSVLELDAAASCEGCEEHFDCACLSAQGVTMLGSLSCFDSDSGSGPYFGTP